MGGCWRRPGDQSGAGGSSGLKARGVGYTEQGGGLGREGCTPQYVHSPASCTHSSARGRPSSRKGNARGNDSGILGVRLTRQRRRGAGCLSRRAPYYVSPRPLYVGGRNPFRCVQSSHIRTPPSLFSAPALYISKTGFEDAVRVRNAATCEFSSPKSRSRARCVGIAYCSSHAPHIPPAFRSFHSTPLVPLDPCAPPRFLQAPTACAICSPPPRARLLLRLLSLRPLCIASREYGLSPAPPSPCCHPPSPSTDLRHTSTCTRRSAPFHPRPARQAPGRGQWPLPGGGVELGEASAAAGCREAAARPPAARWRRRRARRGAVLARQRPCLHVDRRHLPRPRRRRRRRGRGELGSGEGGEGGSGGSAGEAMCAGSASGEGGGRGLVVTRSTTLLPPTRTHPCHNSRPTMFRLRPQLNR